MVYLTEEQKVFLSGYAGRAKRDVLREFAQSIEKTADPLLRQDMEYLAEAVKEMPGEAIPEGKSSFLEEGDA